MTGCGGCGAETGDVRDHLVEVKVSVVGAKSEGSRSIGAVLPLCGRCFGTAELLPVAVFGEGRYEVDAGA